MKESSTYQMILNEGRNEGRNQGLIEGRMEEARTMLLLIGEGKLGKPSAHISATIAAISSPARIESLGKRIFAANSWDELLAPGN